MNSNLRNLLRVAMEEGFDGQGARLGQADSVRGVRGARQRRRPAQEGNDADQSLFGMPRRERRRAEDSGP